MCVCGGGGIGNVPCDRKGIMCAMLLYFWDKHIQSRNFKFNLLLFVMYGVIKTSDFCDINYIVKSVIILYSITCGPLVFKTLHRSRNQLCHRVVFFDRLMFMGLSVSCFYHLSIPEMWYSSTINMFLLLIITYEDFQLNISQMK